MARGGFYGASGLPDQTVIPLIRPQGGADTVGELLPELRMYEKEMRASEESCPGGGLQVRGRLLCELATVGPPSEHVNPRYRGSMVEGTGSFKHCSHDKAKILADKSYRWPQHGLACSLDDRIGHADLCKDREGIVSLKFCLPLIAEVTNPQVFG
jgi:hypothetical protein